MTVDIVPMASNSIAVLDSASDALTRLGEWVDAARHAHQLVAPLVGTAFVPDSYKPKIDPRATPEQKEEARQVAIANATAAVLQGITLGLDPMTALQQIYIVHGRPGMYAKMMVALVQSHGHEVWDEDLSDTRAVVAGRRKGTEHIVRITVTMDQARRAGWTRNEAYGKTPQDMLWSRAASRVCDRIASDALKGIASVEEVQDEIGQANGNGTRTVAPRKRVVARVEPAAAIEPPLDDPVPEDADEPITAPQQKKLHALLREHQLADRDAGLARISEILDRTVESTKDLSKQDAMRVIDALEAPAVVEDPPFDEDWPPVAAPVDGA